MATIKEFTNSNLERDLQKNFALSLKDEKFVKVVNSLKCEEKVLINYTSSLQDTVEELKHCEKCSCLEECKNKMCGFVLYPHKEEDRLEFVYTPCKYKKKENKNITYFEMPIALKNAKMSDIKASGKERIEVIKAMKEILSNYEKGKTKGIYLHGSFGSGKSYLLSALINELSSKYQKNAIVMYYPTLLKNLKSSFNDEFDTMLEKLHTCDILLIDDIGAERNTEWSRDEILSPILQYRMDNELTTFFTSNLNIEELEEHLSKTSTSTDKVKARRIIERIKFLTKDLELIGKNMRN